MHTHIHAHIHTRTHSPERQSRGGAEGLPLTAQLRHSRWEGGGAGSEGEDGAGREGEGVNGGVRARHTRTASQRQHSVFSPHCVMFCVAYATHARAQGRPPDGPMWPDMTPLTTMATYA